MSWRKMIPIEVYPLALFTGAAISFATYRIYKLLNHNEVQLTRSSNKKFEWKDEDVNQPANTSDTIND